MNNIQGLIDEFCSCQEGVMRVVEAMQSAPPTVQVELLPVLDEAMASARWCAKEVADALGYSVYS